MNTFTIARENHEALQELLHQNEVQANKTVGMFLLVLVVGSFISLTGSFVAYSFELVAPSATVSLFTNIIAVIIVLCAWHKKFDAPWVKHWLVGFLFLALMIMIALSPEYSLFLAFVPLFLTVRYFDARFSIRIAIFTIVLLTLITAGHVWLQAASPEIAEYHAWMVAGWWDDAAATFTSWYLTPALIILFLAWYARSIAKSNASIIKGYSDKCGEVNAVESELNMASQIQISSLPATSFTAPGGNFSLAAKELTAREVGGDFYDYYMLDGHRLAVLIADVSDKGVPAALFMMSAKKTLRCALECSTTLEEALSLTTRLMCEDNQSEMFFTLWVAIIDVRTGRGRYANAGHPLPYLKHSDGTIETVDNDPDMFLGNFPNMPPGVHTFQMVPGDTMLLFTDGVTDAESSKGTRFQQQGILDALQGAANGAKSAMEAVMSSACAFSQGMAQFDDMTVLALECLSVDESERVSLCLPACTESASSFLDAAEKLAAEMNCPDSVRRNLELVIDEIAENISMYAYEGVADDSSGLAQDELGHGRMQLDMEMGANYARLRFQDCGTPFDPLAKTDPDVDGEPEIGGLGIYLVKNTVDDIRYERVRNRNVLDILLLWNV